METKLSRSIQRVLSGQFDLLWYALYARMRRLDFSPVQPEALGFDRRDAVEHSNSGGPILESVLRTIPIPSGSRIIDIGSGKGGATFTLAKFPFEEVLGVELSPELVTIAERNARILGTTKVHFACQSATEITEDLDRFTHVYLFNPFSAAIFAKVYSNLLDSLKRKPRTLTVICKHPEDTIEQCFPESSAFKLVSKLEFKLSHPFYVFQTPTNKRAQLQPDDSYNIYCMSCEELIGTAKNRQALNYAAAETLEHVCQG